MNYDDDENETIFYSILKAAVWKLSKNLKTFNEIKNFNKQISKMIKLIKNIENPDNLKKFRMFEKKNDSRNCDRRQSHKEYVGPNSGASERARSFMLDWSVQNLNSIQLALDHVTHRGGHGYINHVTRILEKSAFHQNDLT